jgi:uncharacterized membrane protein YphA (DoxX/SURF4 family)
VIETAKWLSDLVPQSLYKSVVILLGLILFSVFVFLPLKKWFKVKVELTEEFMRNFRWMTPLLLVFDILLHILEIWIIIVLLQRVCP